MTIEECRAMDAVSGFIARLEVTAERMAPDRVAYLLRKLEETFECVTNPPAVTGVGAVPMALLTDDDTVRLADVEVTE